MRTAKGWTEVRLLVWGLLRTVSALAATESRLSTSGHHHHHHHNNYNHHSPSSRESQPTVPLTLRLARRNDVPSIQRCNLATLPENYNQQFYANHLREWPDLAFVAVDCSSSTSSSFSSFPTSSNQPEEKVVAYVLGKVEERTVTIRQPVEQALQGYHDRAMFLQPWPHHYGGSSSSNRNHDRLGMASSSQQSLVTTTTERIGHVTSLAVLEQYRRRGLAVELMRQLHYHLAASHRVDAVGLHVRKSNVAAERLYAGFGYEASECIPGYYQDGEDAYFMKKELRQSQQHNNDNNNKSTSSLFGNVLLRRKVWETGPEDLRLPRIVGMPPEYALVTPPSSREDTPEELLTGSM